MTLSPDDRYSRQVLFRGIGAEGQKRLAAARVVIAGCGATGSALVSLLARAGVGFIRIIDRDYVEPSNLQRQSLFDEQDAAESMPKALAAAKKVSQFNSHITIEPHVADLTPANAEEMLGDVALILDATDNFETRYLINDFSIARGTPWIYAAAVGAYGVTMNILPGETACLSCVFPSAPTGLVETCDTSGILNSAVNLIASIEATEALKFFVGAKEKLRRTMLSVDLWNNERSEISTARPRPDPAAAANSLISTETARPTSPFADATPSRSTSTPARWILPSPPSASPPMAPLSTTISSSNSGAASTNSPSFPMDAPSSRAPRTPHSPAASTPASSAPDSSYSRQSSPLPRRPVASLVTHK